MITRRIVQAEDWKDIRKSISEYESCVNMRHLTTAMYFLTKKNKHRLARNSSVDDPVLLTDLSWIKEKILELGDAEDWSSASLTNVLQACSLLRNEPSFTALAALALNKIAQGSHTVSNSEYVTILSCMVHMEATDARTSALSAMEAALSPSVDANTIVLAKGIQGFHARDFGHLSWALTELHCSQNVAEFVFGHAFGCIGGQNLSPSSLCLLCRMISLRGSRHNAEDHLETILTCLERENILQRMSYLRDSTMMLLSISRLVKSACDKEDDSRDSISSGLKWTMSVILYRRSHRSMMRIVDELCSCIVASMEHPGIHADHSVYSGILYSLALLQYRSSSDLLYVCLEGLEEKMNSLTLRTIATCSWSLSVLRYDDIRMMHVFASRVLQGGLIKDFERRDISQAISMILYSFSVLNVFQDEAFEPFLAELMKAAISCMAQMAPESLPIFGWSVMVSHSRSDLMNGEIFEQTMRRWRSEVAENAPALPRATLALVHHTEIALALESPTLGLEMNTSFESSINMMYASGRVKRYAMREWNTQHSSMESDLNQQIAFDGISLFQKQVYQAANKLHPGWLMEYWDEKLQYPVDMALPSKKIVIEADGPTHFTCNTKKPLGATALKRRLLKKLGWNLLVVPYYEWNTQASQDEQDTYMSGKLESILQSIPESIPESMSESISESIAAEEQQEERSHLSPDEVEQVQKNASVLDILNARQGKMSLNRAMKRQIMRKNKQ